jgi:hypothetical protein
MPSHRATYVHYDATMTSVDLAGEGRSCGTVVPLYGVAIVPLPQALSLEMGFTLSSLLAFGGVGSLVLGLACQVGVSAPRHALHGAITVKSLSLRHTLMAVRCH